MSISIYWIGTALLCLLYLASAGIYLAKGEFVRKAQAELGYSAPLLVPWMIVIKILGPVAIVWRFNTKQQRARSTSAAYTSGPVEEPWQ